MSFWFYRNPIKFTSKINFDNFKIPSDVSSRSICNEISIRRGKLLEIINDPKANVDSMKEALQQYIHYIYGFIVSPHDNAKYNSKIKTYTPVRWTDSITLSTDDAVVEQDFVYEFASMLLNVSFWYAKHSAFISTNTIINEEDGKELHKSMRIAMGLIKFIKDELLGYLENKPKENTDFHLDILNGYYYQFNAEAQEFVTQKAIQLDHQPSLISALAYETAKLYKDAQLSIKPCADKFVGKWKEYLELKHNCYMAYAYCFQVGLLLKDNKGGEAIASGNSAVKYRDEFLRSIKAYKKAQGVYISQSVPEIKMFNDLDSLCDRQLDTAKRENSMIYRQPVPDTVPQLQLKASHGLVEPIMPDVRFEHHDDWNKAYTGFSDELLMKYIIEMKDQQKKEKKESNLKIHVTNEKPIYTTDREKSLFSSLFTF